MQVDSMHAVIERKVRNCIVWAPSEWSTLIRNARVSKQPYTVREMVFSDFINWKALLGYFGLNKTNNLSTGGSKVSWNNIKIIKFQKSGDSFAYKTGYDDSYWKTVPMAPSIFTKTRGVSSSNVSILNQAYTSDFPISVAKFNDLKSLCDKNIIPLQYQQEYAVMKKSQQVKDQHSDSDD